MSPAPAVCRRADNCEAVSPSTAGGIGFWTLEREKPLKKERRVGQNCHASEVCDSNGSERGRDGDQECVIRPIERERERPCPAEISEIGSPPHCLVIAGLGPGYGLVQAPDFHHQGVTREQNIHPRMVKSFEGVTLNHVARETRDVKGTAKFYEEIFGFKPIETPQEFGDTVVWLQVPPAHYLHIIKRHEDSHLPESPFTATEDAKLDESALQTGHHLSFRVADYDAAVALLKEKKVKYFEKTQQDGSIKQCFFFDPDGNGLEIGNWPLESHC